MSNLIKFRVSAPGKVILHGEHSVVYGKPAVAGVIGLRNYLTFHEQNNDIIQIIFPKIGTKFNISLTDFNSFLATSFSKLSGDKLPDDLNHCEWFDCVKSFVSSHNKELMDDKSLCGLSSVFYLLVGILIDQKIDVVPKSFELRSETEMGIGAGIGSSASFGVCLAGIFYYFSKLLQKPTFNSNDLTSTFTKEYISKWAFCSEKIMHGNPSGLDNTICTFGNIVKFYKGIAPIDVHLSMPLNILLVDTKVSRSTAKLVENVSNLRRDHPKLIDHVMSAMGELVEDAVGILEKYSGDSDDFQKLVRLVTINNNLLRTIGVSHESLEKIFLICEMAGFAVKLTGAGGGGYATVFLPSNYKTLDKFDELRKNLEAAGFDCIETTVGGEGVRFEEL